MIEKYSLRKTAEICNISLPTAFAWRHKILDALQEIQDSIKFDGIVEAGETFMSISYKGNHKSFNFPCLVKKRGAANAKRGLSKELVCIPCIVNSNAKPVDNIANLGKPDVKALNSFINGKLKRNSIFVTDSLRLNLKLLSEMVLSHIRMYRNRYKLGAFNIQTINKNMLIHGLKSVSTKYLNNYLIYHNFVNFAKESRKDKEQILFKHILNTDCISKSISVANRPALPLMVE